MPGVRLHHPNLRSVTYTVRHEGRKYQYPLLCSMCKETHEYKTYHLSLDGVGDVVVSEVILARLREAGLGDLKVLGIEHDPEPVVLDMGSGLEQFNVVKREV